MTLHGEASEKDPLGRQCLLCRCTLNVLRQLISFPEVVKSVDALSRVSLPGVA